VVLQDPPAQRLNPVIFVPLKVIANGMPKRENAIKSQLMLLVQIHIVPNWMKLVVLSMFHAFGTPQTKKPNAEKDPLEWEQLTVAAPLRKLNLPV